MPPSLKLPAQPTEDALLRLCEHAENGSVSIYMALPKKRTTVTAYRARLRQLVRAAETQTPHAADAVQVIKAVEEFAQEPNLWLTSHRGLAIFASKNGLETFYLRHAVQDLATVSDHFYLKPIMEGLPFDRQCLVVVLTVDGVDLFLANRAGVDLVDRFELPESIAPSHRIPGVQLRSQGGAGGKTRGAIFHGHTSDAKQKETAKRLRVIDDWICERISPLRHLPMVLAGVNYLTSAFRADTKCPNLLLETIEGSRLTKDEVTAGARAILESAARDEFETERKRYLALVGTPRVATNYEEILDAAKDGRVDTAFIAADRNQWMSGSQMGLREDIFDRIGVETHLTRGTVFVVPESQTPSGEGACAILRF